ncbi:MAG: ABC transporter ATP-binding protein [Oscillatoria sp. SIO1A7]|nr:ABC transporter ATP-binding protein [Oscillatoria sp. SIO1A7]
MIEVENLSKTYGSTLAIEDVSFSVGAGEILGFLGPNGAGKTTTMRILSGYLPATRGTAKIAGYEVHQDSMAVRQRIGYLPETLPLYPDMTVEGYLHFVARLKLVSPGDRSRQVYETMQRCNLLEKDKVLIRKLSRGYRQRVGIAQAIVHNPPVIILDEPTSALDPRQIIEVRNLIKSLAGDHTIVLSTHILSEASATCTQVAIIDRGKMVAIDSLDNMMGQLSQSSGYELEIDGDPENSLGVVQIIQELKGVRSVEIISKDPSKKPGTKQHSYILRALCETGEELAPQIVGALASAGVNLSEMRRTRASLESVFLELTGEAETSSLLREKGARDRADEERQPIEDSENNSPEANPVTGDRGAVSGVPDKESPEASEKLAAERAEEIEEPVEEVGEKQIEEPVEEVGEKQIEEPVEEVAEVQEESDQEQQAKAKGRRRGFFSRPWGRPKDRDNNKESSGNSQESTLERDSMPSAPGLDPESQASPNNLGDESASSSKRSELEATAINPEEPAAKVSDSEEMEDFLKEDLWKNSSGSASGNIERKSEISQKHPESDLATGQRSESKEGPTPVGEDKESGLAFEKASEEIEEGKEQISNLSSSSQAPKEEEQGLSYEERPSLATDKKGRSWFGWWPWGRRKETLPEPPKAQEELESETSSEITSETTSETSNTTSETPEERKPAPTPPSRD